MFNAIICHLAILATLVYCSTAAGDDLTSLPLERLLNFEVSSASKFPQKISEAPSAVSVVTSDEIRNYGYRTLADILKSLRGLYVNYDRNYTYLGTRGFARSGDYNTRILILIDGTRFNDGVYDQAAIGTDFPLDVDLIDRVEFIPGPGSAVYGSNAFFGVINVITRKGGDINGLELSGEVASANTTKGRISYGKRLENGAEMLVSTSGYDSRGKDIAFTEFGGVAHHLDYDRYQHLFAKVDLDNLSLGLIHSERTKGIPTASYSQVFDDPRSYTLDEYTVLQMKYAKPLSETLEMSASLHHGRYDYSGDYVLDYPPVTLNRDQTESRWWGGELRFLSTAFRGHKLVVGTEYRSDGRIDQFNHDAEPVYASYLEDRRSKRSYGLFVQDEWTLSDRLALNLGLRHDHSSVDGSSNNPRLGLIYSLVPDTTTLKLLYGSAYRAANAYEKYYVADPANYKISPDLQPERIKTLELVAEHYWSDNLRTTAALYSNRIDNLISYDLDPADGKLHFVNLSQAEARGLELEGERLFDSGARLRASYTWQYARDSNSGEWLTNSPKHLAKLNYSVPLPGDAWLAGLELQYASTRKTLHGSETGSNLVANLTLLGKKLARNLEASFSIYNLFDRVNADPASTEHSDSQGRILDVLRQDGRVFRAKLTYRF